MAFRAARSPIGLGRRTDKTVITTYAGHRGGLDIVLSRHAAGKVGRRCNWCGLPRVRIVAAHVSIIDEPGSAKPVGQRHESRGSSGRHSRPSGRRGGEGGRRVDRPRPIRQITRAEECGCNCGRDRARRCPGAGLTRPTSQAFQRVAHAGARGAAATGGLGLVDARRTAARGGAAVIERLTGMFEAMADWRRCALALPPNACSLERHRLEAIHEELRVLSHAAIPTVSRNQRALSQRDLCRLADGYIARLRWRRECGCSRSARAVPQSRPAGQIARRARPRRGSDHASDRVGASAAMRAHIELVRDEYELYAVSVSPSHVSWPQHRFCAGLHPSNSPPSPLQILTSLRRRDLTSLQRANCSTAPHI